VFLSTDESSWMTGGDSVDGGLTPIKGAFNPCREIQFPKSALRAQVKKRNVLRNSFVRTKESQSSGLGFDVESVTTARCFSPGRYPRHKQIHGVVPAAFLPHWRHDGCDRCVYSDSRGVELATLELKINYLNRAGWNGKAEATVLRAGRNFICCGVRDL
jgi:hypothetical protein